ncbi:hypothetical protein CspHIS471_0307640 [Cutaneotrichosporon sp. HIS471]|nr:hypothetical protein CspHIS471_0307640 [Cutaneotrichosporon sp. HIS471]
MALRYIGQKLAQQIDEELMSASGAFSIDQLMELAGLSCAQALAKSFPVQTHKRVLGGDGLVAARHLHHFSYTPTIYYPKPGNKDLYQRLLTQARNLGIPIVDTDGFPAALGGVADTGFSFHPPVRAPFDNVLTALVESHKPVVSVDIPSGWGVEEGRQRLTNTDGKEVATIDPEVLVSLTAPKEGVRSYTGKHWLGGRFVPDDLAKRHKLNLPPYPGVDQVVELPPPGKL